MTALFSAASKFVFNLSIQRDNNILVCSHFGWHATHGGGLSFSPFQYRFDGWFWDSVKPDVWISVEYSWPLVIVES
jgi:hypothetical protein